MKDLEPPCWERRKTSSEKCRTERLPTYKSQGSWPRRAAGLGLEQPGWNIGFRSNNSAISEGSVLVTWRSGSDLATELIKAY